MDRKQMMRDLTARLEARTPPGTYSYSGNANLVWWRATEPVGNASSKALSAALTDMKARP